MSFKWTAFCDTNPNSVSSCTSYAGLQSSLLSVWLRYLTFSIWPCKVIISCWELEGTIIWLWFDLTDLKVYLFLFSMTELHSKIIQLPSLTWTALPQQQTKADWLQWSVLFSTIINAYYRNHKEHKNTLCILHSSPMIRQSVHSQQCTLKGKYGCISRTLQTQC